jgi:hypothetical protein
LFEKRASCSCAKRLDAQTPATDTIERKRFFGAVTNVDAMLARASPPVSYFDPALTPAHPAQREQTGRASLPFRMADEVAEQLCRDVFC